MSGPETAPDEIVEAVARAMRRNRFVRTRIQLSFDENMPPTETELDDARTAIEAHRAALAAAGYKIVAREPTEAMTEAAASPLVATSREWVSKWWRAMWDAAP